MLVNIIQNTISSFRSALAAAEVITTNLKMWLGFETSETLGTEEVVNGDFATDLSNWSIANSDSTHTVIHTSNGARFQADTSDATFTFTSGTANIVSGRRYQIKVVISEYQGSNGIKIQSSATGNVNYLFDSVDTFTYSFTAVSNSSNPIQFYRNGANVDITIESVSLKELTQITPDKSGNNNVGELFTGKALDFDGANDYVNTTGFEMAGTSFTFAFWIYPKATTYQFIMDLDVVGTNQRSILGLFQENSDPQKFAWYNNPGGFRQFGTPTQNEWQRVVFRVSPTTVECYVNGIQSGTTQSLATAHNYSNINNSVIGGRNNFGTTQRLDGSLSDFQIYNAYWSTDDIAYDYANPQNLVTDRSGTSITLSNLKAYWAMSEGAGSLAYNSAVPLGADVVVDGDFPLPNNNWDIGNGTEITASGARVNNTVTGGIAFVKQFLTNNPFGKTFVFTYDVIATNGNLLALQQASDLDLNTSTTGTNRKLVFTWNRNIDELTIKRKGGQTGGTDVTIDNVALQEISVGYINGAAYEPAQPRIQQLGMMNWAKSTPVADEVTLIPKPNNTSEDILGNAVRDRLNSFNLDGTGYAKVDDSTSLGITNGTLQFWLKTSDTNFTILEGAVAKEYIGRTNNNAWSNGGTATINTFIDNAVSSSQPLYDNDWHFYTFTGININLWTEFSIGTETLDGLISDVLIYDTVLTSTEIENNYNAGLSAHTND